MEGLKGIIRTLVTGSRAYKLWLTLLFALISVAIVLLYKQSDQGLIVTNMRDPVSWGWYIANFTFLVGVAAAAVVLVVPAYLYHHEGIKDIVLLGEIMAISAVSMCLIFVTIDMGSPERFWHLIPKIGIFNFPQSILAWDVFVLNLYLFLNLFLVTYGLYKMYTDKPYNKKLIWPLILFSIPAAISIHTVTAFIYVGLPSRPFWNAAILAPRFIASAFCSGPALMLILFQVIRKTTRFEVSDRALFKVGEIITYAMSLNLFFLISELYKEHYIETAHIASVEYLWSGLHGHNQLVPWIWTALAFNLTAFLLLLIPKTRMKLSTLNLACILIFAGVYIEKGMGLVFPGFIPSTLGEIYDYFPNALELWISLGVWAAGMLIFTVLAKIAIAIKTGELKAAGK
ncbi:MAG: NrfD/PsrC family molybdoenzyme membrane anchor subunit [Thermodesulfovibrionia bacterium]|nr:NrfD/PsrC family molybdoenzyme membrane anchor subunit [Thermodesulfovibrionia bacterium]